MGKTLIPGINFTGGTGGSGSSLQTLSDAELAGLNGSDVSTPNSILDTYNTELATLGANSEIISSLVRLIAGQNSAGTVEHELGLSVNMGSVDGGMVVSLHAAAVQSVSGNDVVVKGDATAIFPDAGRILISTKTEQLGRTTHVGLTNDDNNIARLVVASTNFDGTDTTITVTNTQGLDLDMGVATIDMPDQLRIAPFDWDLEASATGTGAYEEMDITDFHGIDTIRLEGTNFYKLIDETIEGTVNELQGTMSQDGQFGLIRIEEKTAGNSTFHWYGSKNRGDTWTKVVGTRDKGQAGLNEGNHNHQYAHRDQLAVANNGLFFSAYPFFNGNQDAHGVIGDLSIITPTLSDSADNGNGPGVINASGSSESVTVGIDPIDGSYVGAAIANTTNNAILYTYTAGGAAFDFTSITIVNWDFDTPYFVKISGTAGAHRVHTINRNSGTGFPQVKYWDEGNATIQSYSGESSASGHIIDAMINDTYLVYIRELASTGLALQYVEYGVSTVFQPQVEVSNLAPDLDNGADSASALHLWKSVGMRLKSNPVDDKHIIAICDLVQPTAQERMSSLIEIKDITTVTQGNPFADTDANSTTFGISAAREQVAQSFTPSEFNGAFDLRSAQFRLYKTGNPAGDLKCELRNTAAGVPTTLIATSDTISGSNITLNTNPQWVYFNFDTPQTLDSGTEYALVLVPVGHVVNGTDYWFIKRSNTSAGTVANGTSSTYNGTIWATDDYDLDFFTRDNWVDYVGLGQGLVPGIKNLYDCESSMELIDSNQMKLLFRRTYAGSNTVREAQGVPFERTLTISNTASKSTYTDETCAVYDENGVIPDYDRNLAFNCYLGLDLARQKDSISGVLNTDLTVNGGRGGYDLSEFAYDTFGPSGTFVNPVDNDFQNDTCLDLNGSSDYVGYSPTRWLDINRGDQGGTGAFIMEAEIKPGTIQSGCILSKYREDSGIEAGFTFEITATGRLVFFAYDEGSSFRNSQSVDATIAASTFYKVRASRAASGDPVDLFISTGAALTAGPNGESVFTEVTYAGQESFNDIADAAGRDAYVGTRDTSVAGGVQLGAFFNGKIGYIKFNSTSNTFAYDGHKPQQAVVSVQALGANLTLGKQFRGEAQDSATTYYDAGVAKDGNPLVDSYDIFLKMGKTFAAPGKDAAVRTTMKRGDEAIQSNEQGRMFTFIKE